MRSLFVAIAIFVLSMLCDPIELSAQKPSTSERLKIGLVLAGGGAKGASHVGVIKVLEELGVPIDYIAGTSMGAIVGGLYASGMSANELETAIKSIDWEDVFNDKPTRADRDFRRKLDDEGSLIRFKLGFKDGEFQLPRGIILGQKLNFILRKLAQRAIGIDDFDRLPIPFRAVAADIETGKPVILGTGDLANAMRASMSVSGVFPPMEIDGKLLVDGGLANNVPIDVVRDMGADIAIVVSFREHLMKRGELKSAVTIVLQSLDLLISQNSKLQLKALGPRDILILPNLGDLGAGSFNRAAEAIPIGEEAARSIEPRLRKLAKMNKSGNIAVKSRSPIAPESITVDFIRIKNNSRLSDELISSRLQIRPGDKLDLDTLEKNIADIYGLDYFETVEYQIVMEGDKSGVVVIANEKTTGLDSFRFGLELDNNFEGDSSYGLSVRFQKEGVNALGGELILQANIGDDLGFLASFLQPLDAATRYYIAPSIAYQARDVPTFENGERTSEFRVRTAILQLLAARQLDNWGAVSLGILRGVGEREVNIGPTALQDSDFDVGEYFVRINLDTFDNIDFPNNGNRARAEFRRSSDAIGGDETFNNVSAKFSAARTWSKDTYLASVSTGITFSGVAPTQNLFQIGGFGNLVGFSRNELSGQNFGLGQLVYYRNIGAQPGSFSVPVYIGATLEAGNVWNDRSDMDIADLIVAGSAFIGLDTPIGPVYLAYGHADGGNRSAYLFLGRPF